MKKLLLTLAAIPAATMAVEASAQTYVGGNAGYTIQNQIAQLQNQVNVGVQSGSIDGNEARRLRQEIRQLNRMQAQYASNGLTTQEWNLLQQRVGMLNQQLQMASNGYGNQPYGNAYGYNGAGNAPYGNAYGYNGAGNAPYGNAYGYNGNQQGYNGNSGYTVDRYGNRVQNQMYDQYGRPVNNGYSNDYYGQGGPYVPVPQQRSSGMGNVLGGVLGSVVGGGGGGGGILGNILGRGGLSVGSVITSVLGSALGNVPSNYSNRYRSQGDTYFRTDGERVYEIDSRTNTVVRVHPYR